MIIKITVLKYDRKINLYSEFIIVSFSQLSIFDVKSLLISKGGGGGE